MVSNSSYFNNSLDGNIRLANAGPSSPVKYYEDSNSILPYFGSTRVNNVRPKPNYTLQDVFGLPTDRASTNENFNTLIALGKDTDFNTQDNKQSNLLDRVTDFFSRIKKRVFTPGTYPSSESNFEVIKRNGKAFIVDKERPTGASRVLGGILDYFDPETDRDKLGGMGVVDDKGRYSYDPYGGLTPFDAYGELTKNIFNNNVPNVDKMIRNIDGAFKLDDVSKLDVSEPSQKRTVKIFGRDFPQSKFGKPYDPVLSPMETGMGSRYEAKALAKAKARKISKT